jgi:hypothetical protein
MNDAITECPKCLLKHNSEDHVLKRLRAICPSISKFPDKLHIIVIFLMRHIYEYAKHINDDDRDKSNFVIELGIPKLDIVLIVSLVCSTLLLNMVWNPRID